MRSEKNPSTPQVTIGNPAFKEETGALYWQHVPDGATVIIGETEISVRGQTVIEIGPANRVSATTNQANACDLTLILHNTGIHQPKISFRDEVEREFTVEVE